MLLMIHLCVKVGHKSQEIRGPDRYFTGKLQGLLYLLCLCTKKINSFYNYFKILIGTISGIGQTFNPM